MREVQTHWNSPRDQVRRDWAWVWRLWGDCAKRSTKPEDLKRNWVCLGNLEQNRQEDGTKNYSRGEDSEACVLKKECSYLNLGWTPSVLSFSKSSRSVQSWLSKHGTHAALGTGCYTEDGIVLLLVFPPPLAQGEEACRAVQGLSSLMSICVSMS